MKKILGILLLLSLTVALAACGGKDDDKTIKVDFTCTTRRNSRKAKPLLEKKVIN